MSPQIGHRALLPCTNASGRHHAATVLENKAAPAPNLLGSKPPAAIKAATTDTSALQALTELVMQHHLVPRWLLKIDDERGGRGHAYIDVASVPAIGQALDYYSIMLSRNAGGQAPHLKQPSSLAAQRWR